MMVYVFTEFCDCSFSQSEVRLGETASPHPKARCKKPPQNSVKALQKRCEKDVKEALGSNIFS